ncbi:MAG: bile acid:sodium symporter family protein [Gammaproteobacteria bacterium]
MNPSALGISAVKTLFRFIHKRFLWMMILCYVVAALFPAFGLWIRDTTCGSLAWNGQAPIKITLPLVMLSLLLFNAGIGINAAELKSLAKQPLLLVAGLAANLLLPLAFTFIAAKAMDFWHNSDEVQNILVGLALIASMPIAASSTAWSQKSSGNLSLSLGLVVATTALSPLTTPFGLHAVSLMTTGDYAEDLNEIAQQHVNTFLFVSVLIPTLCGIAVHFLFANRLKRIMPVIKNSNLINLMLLNYANAAAVLPSAFEQPDWDFLLAIGIIAGALCCIAFWAGYYLPCLLKAGNAEKSSLMFGLGMNNNGAGLVLASMLLFDHPLVMLPIIVYNLMQQIAAGVADYLLKDKEFVPREG